MRLHRVFDDGESEACSAYLAGAAGVDAVESLEEACQVFALHSGAVVVESEGVEFFDSTMSRSPISVP